MEHDFICPTCRMNHREPAYAGLGHLIVCLECANETTDEQVSTPFAASLENGFAGLAA